jgi:hypothetical protein
MKRMIIGFGVIVSLFLCVVSPVSALEIGFDAWAGNVGFTTNRASTDTSYPGIDYFWGGNVYAEQSISDEMSFQGGYAMDPILRNVVFGLLDYTKESLTIGVGPYMGVFNDSGMPLKAGLSVLLKLELPGLFYASLKSDATIGADLQLSGDYTQERNNIAFGFYVKNAICTLSMDTRKFTQLLAAVRVADALTAYSFQTEIFQKNVPYRLGITLSYQTLSKSYTTGTVTVSDILNTFVVGTRLDLIFSDSFFIYANLESNLYSFGQGQLTGGTTSAFLFRASTGFKLNLDVMKGAASAL